MNKLNTLTMGGRTYDSFPDQEVRKAVDFGVEPAEDDIPKVFFGGALPQTKDDTVMSFRYISKTMDISGFCKTKAQGNSSMSYPKKNQTVKLYKDAACTEKLKVDFKSWGKQNKFCFKANWIDLTHARNIVSARLWGDVVKSRANYDTIPELLRTSPNQGAVDGFPVKVYAGGIYQGRYTINIPKDAWMANMDDELDEHCILCGENYVSGCFRAEAKIDETDWTDEVHDTVPDSIKTRWNAAIDFIMSSTDEEFANGIGNYFDIESLIDYHLFGLASCGFDAYGKNQIYMTYDGQKWIASMYDMDSTWGLYWNGSKFVATDYARTDYEDFASSDSSGEGNLLYIRLEQIFYEKLQSRWAKLKAGALSIENIINRFERFTDIAPTELVGEDYASTTVNGNYTGIPSKTTNNIQQIRSFALARLAWTDEYVSYMPNGAPGEEETTIVLDKASLTFNEYGKQMLTASVSPISTDIEWSSSNEDVAVVNNGVVTALSNGSATITAVCNGKSASCIVTVLGIENAQYYRLSEAKTFNGTSDFVDTGMKLFDIQKDFTILMEANLSQGYAANANSNILHCMNEVSPWPGLNMAYAGDGLCKLGGCTGSTGGGSWQNGISNADTRLAIRFVDGVYDTVFWLEDGVIRQGQDNLKHEGPYVQHDKQLLLGCYQTTAGAKGRYWKGEIRDFSVHCAAMSDARIAEYLMATE